MATADAASEGFKRADAWQALLRDKSLQFTFPDANLDTKPPSWFLRFTAFLAQHHRAIVWGIWILLGAGVLIAAWFVYRWLSRGGIAQADAPPPRQLTPWQPSVRQARLLLADADGLAAQGRFDEAVHLLLLVAIQEIGERQPGSLAPALTSREIAQLPVLSALAQRIFSGIAEVVEHSLFGGRAIGHAEFARCRAAFEQFTQGHAWQVAA